MPSKLLCFLTLGCGETGRGFDRILIIMQEQEQTAYQRYLASQLSAAFAQNSDRTPTQALYADITNRSEIFYMQYEITKRGKKTGSLEKRWVRIEGDSLLQVSEDNLEKELPYPTNIYIHRRPYESDEEWQGYDSKYQGRIEVYFEERSPITVLFRQLIQCNEVAMKLLAGIREREGVRLFSKTYSAFAQAITTQVYKKIQEAREGKQSLPKIRLRQRATQNVRKTLSDTSIFQSFLSDWMSKSLFKEGRMTVHVRFLQVLAVGEVQLGEIKVWGGGRVRQNFLLQFEEISCYNCHSFSVYSLGGDYVVSLMGLDARDDIEIEMEIGGVMCRSERFTPCDLRRRVVENRLLDLRMYSKNFSCILRVAVEVERIGFYPPQIEPICPQHYQVITSLSTPPKQSNYQRADIHQYHAALLEEDRQSLPYKASFSHFRPLSHLLKLQELISKFTQVAPFNIYAESPHVVTAIYQHLLDQQRHNRYYEVQKIIWKTSKKHIKPILVALKAFDDQNPKFNFTEPFLSLALRMEEVAQSVGINRWPSKWLECSTRGIESLTFLLCLGIIKAFPSVLLWQQPVNRKALPFNSLLFHYILRNYLPQLLSKLNMLQLNYEAYFGVHFASLLSSLFHSQTYNKILVMLLEQRQKQFNLYLFGVIGAFIAMLEFTDDYQCAYLTAEHFMLTFQELCRRVPDPFFLFSRMKHWSLVAKQTVQTTLFAELADDLARYYATHAYSAQIGDISKQIYQEFSCYNLRREGDWRRLIFWVDRIQLGFQSKTIKLSLYQCGSKLYEHVFGGVLGGAGLEHCVELRLVRLQEVSVIVTGGEESYCCRLDPKQIPSNLYMHLVESLVPTRHLAPLKNSHICMQVYIKDNTEIDSLDNPLPQQFRTLLLESNISKETLQFIKNYTKTARLRQNNFNLLYSKLGWFGCHYLVPTQRLISVEVLGAGRSGEVELRKQAAEAGRYTRAVYGKTIIPFPNEDGRNLFAEFVKHDVVTTMISKGLSTGLNDTGAYNSAGELVGYPLETFPMYPGTSFVNFHYRLSQLPLIDHLIYRPKQFYLLPSFAIQVSNQHSVCTVIIADKGLPFKTDFSEEESGWIEGEAAKYHKLPTEVEFSYTDESLLYDEFVYYLRLNLLQQVVLGQGQRRGKLRRWANSLVSTTASIPNYPLHNFYQLMNETKYTLHLEFKQTKPVPIHLQYQDYACIYGRWILVACLAIVRSRDKQYHYVLTRQDRKKHLLISQEVIRAGNGAETVEVVEEEGESMESLTYRLSSLFSF